MEGDDEAQLNTVMKQQLLPQRLVLALRTRASGAAPAVVQCGGSRNCIVSGQLLV
jgi:hypothetical protein